MIPSLRERIIVVHIFYRTFLFDEVLILPIEKQEKINRKLNM